MRSKLAVVGGLVALLTSLFLVFTLLPAASQGGGGDKRVLCSRANEGTETEVDNDGNGEESPGDHVLFVDPVYDFETGDRVGKEVGRFTFVRTKGENDGFFMVEIMVILKNGKISAFAAGKFSDFEGGATFPVTGGTGHYANVSGTATVKGTKDCGGKRGERVILDLNLG